MPAARANYCFPGICRRRPCGIKLRAGGDRTAYSIDSMWVLTDYEKRSCFGEPHHAVGRVSSAGCPVPNFTLLLASYYKDSPLAVLTSLFSWLLILILFSPSSSSYGSSRSSLLLLCSPITKVVFPSWCDGCGTIQYCMRERERESRTATVRPTPEAPHSSKLYQPS